MVFIHHCRSKTFFIKRNGVGKFIGVREVTDISNSNIEDSHIEQK